MFRSNIKIFSQYLNLMQNTRKSSISSFQIFTLQMTTIIPITRTAGFVKIAFGCISIFILTQCNLTFQRKILFMSNVTFLYEKGTNFIWEYINAVHLPFLFQKEELYYFLTSDRHKICQI